MNKISKIVLTVFIATSAWVSGQILGYVALKVKPEYNLIKVAKEDKKLLSTSLVSYYELDSLGRIEKEETKKELTETYEDLPSLLDQTFTYLDIKERTYKIDTLYVTGKNESEGFFANINYVWSKGSGFAISENLILTASHVLVHDGVLPNWFFVGGKKASSFAVYQEYLTSSNRIYDFAVIELSEPLNFNHNNNQENVIGDADESKFVSLGYSDLIEPSDHLHVSYGKKIEETSNCFYSTAFINKGMSGGPTFEKIKNKTKETTFKYIGCNSRSVHIGEEQIYAGFVANKPLLDIKKGY